MDQIGLKRPIHGKNTKKAAKGQLLWSRRESNLDLKFRKLLFYPLNYETKVVKKPQLRRKGNYSNLKIRELLGFHFCLLR